MGLKYPHVVHLTSDDIDYELKIRGFKEEIAKPIAEKQKFLRRVYREDKLEKKTYQSIFNIDQEHDWLLSNIEKLRVLLERDPQPKYISRLRYFHMRASRSNVSTEQSKTLKASLLKVISDLVAQYDVGESESDGDKTDQEEEIEEAMKKELELKKKAEQLRIKEEEIKRKEEELKKREEEQKQNPLDPGKLETAVMEAVKKLFSGPCPFPDTKPLQIPIQSKQEDLVQSTSNNDLTKQVKSLEKQLQQMKDLMRQVCIQNTNQRGISAENLAQALNTIQNSAGNVTQNQANNRNLNNSNPLSNPIDPNQNPPDPSANPPNPHNPSNPPNPPNPPNPLNRPNPLLDFLRNPNQEDSSEDEPEVDWTVNTERDYGRTQYDRRIEKWNIYFSGDQRSTTLEDFIYKIKVLANMNHIPKPCLLSHMHLLLRGEAANWFFAYFHPTWDWDTFEIEIRYRFGNPNQEQGNRQRIYDRKQQKGEKFIAFVSEVERLNKLLTKPLSTRRKFEIIWENMRPHYRSKLACFRVDNLAQLVDLNYRIDANDPSLHQPGSRHAVQNLEAETDISGSDDEAEVNAIYRKSQGKGSQKPSSSRNETTRLPVCWNCRNHGHFWRQCTESKTTFCYICGNPGTVAATCEKHPKRETTGKAGEPSGNQDRNA